MKNITQGIINKLERIPVSGVNAILMGESLKELYILNASLPEEKPPEGEPDEQPEEGEENVNSDD